MVISLGAYMAILGALCAERLYELMLATRNTRCALAMGGIEAGQGHYPMMQVFHVLFILSAATEAIVRRPPFAGVVGWIAFGGALGAQALRYWCVTTLGPRWNTRIIVMPGLAPVTAGPYRFLRHPNYLAVVIEIACIPAIRGCWLTASVFSVANAILLAVRIRAEEIALGPAYELAFGRRRRLLPSLPPRRGDVGRRSRPIHS